MPKWRLCLCATEASGDLIGAQLIEQLQAHGNVEIFGIGGTQMAHAGQIQWATIHEISVMGLTEILKHLPRLYRLRKSIQQQCLSHHIHCFIGIDGSDFNLGLSRQLKKQGIYTAQYVSPMVWAWRKNRIPKIARSIDALFCLFPFEPALFEHTDLECHFVGHPITQLPRMTKTAARQQFSMEKNRTYVLLLPGSRPTEIQRLWPHYQQLINMTKTQHHDWEFIVGLAHTEHAALIDTYLPTFIGQTHTLMQACDVALAASGTATLELAYFGCPMVVTYATSPITYYLVKHLLHIPYIALPNILMEQPIVPEFIQNLPPDALLYSLEEALCHPQRAESLQQHLDLTLQPPPHQPFLQTLLAHAPTQ